jgi:hypothetical protein
MDSRCPRKLSKTPCNACPEGKRAVDLARKGLEGGCPWFVADAESHYCFFKFMDDRGDGRPVKNSAKIARMLMMDDGQVKKVVSKFKKDFKDILFPESATADGDASPDPAKNQ